MKDEEELWVNVINGAPLHHRCKSASPTSLASGSWRWRYLHNQQPRCVCGVHVKYPGKAGLSPPPHGKELHRNQMFNKYIHRRLLYSQFPTPNNYIYIYLKKLNINVLNTTVIFLSRIPLEYVTFIVSKICLWFWIGSPPLVKQDIVPILIHPILKRVANCFHGFISWKNVVVYAHILLVWPELSGTDFPKFKKEDIYIYCMP